MTTRRRKKRATRKLMTDRELIAEIKRQDAELAELLNDDSLLRKIAEQDRKILDALKEQDAAIRRALGGE